MRGAKAESAVRERGRPVEPDPGNAGEGKQLRYRSLQRCQPLNERHFMIASKTSFEPHSAEPLPNSAKVHVSGEIHPELRVPFREITLSPTKSFNGRSEPNAPVRVYDCSGAWGDPDFHGEVEQGLPPLRQPWIQARGEIEEVTPSYKPIAGRSDAFIPPALQRKAFRAKGFALQGRRNESVTAACDRFVGRRDFLDLSASLNPRLPQWRKPLLDFSVEIGIAPCAGAVIHANRRVRFRPAIKGFGGTESDFAERNPKFWVYLARNVHFGRIGKGFRAMRFEGSFARNHKMPFVQRLAPLKGAITKLLPFASITWIRFNGSAALPHSTLSLRASHARRPVWLPCNSGTLVR